MIMFKKLPYFVFLDNKKYRINVDFRNMIFFENKIESNNINKADKIKYGIMSFYPYFCNENNYQCLLHNPKLYEEACEKLIWFYKCGREDYHKAGKGHFRNDKQIYSYEYDDEYIYGAFYEQYGIDLSYAKVHWWKFKALLKSLKDDTEFVKIKGYRAYDGKDENMKKLKAYWSLPKPIEEQKRLDRLYEILK